MDRLGFSDRDDLTGTMLEGRYAIGEVLREGEHTNVYAAEDVRTGSPATMEVLRDGLGSGSLPARTLRRRAIDACRVRHPNALMPRDVGALPDQTPFIVATRLEGETLEERVCLAGAMQPSEVVRIGIEIVSALGAAHDADVAHGGIGPDSIFLAMRDGILLSAMLSGFGAERAPDEETALGFSTTAFRPPEVAAQFALPVHLGRSRSEMRVADLYAIGAVLYLAATGLPPYSAPSRAALAEVIGAGTLRVQILRPDLPDRLAAALVRALSPDPHDRFAGADEMLVELSSLREAKSDSAPEKRRGDAFARDGGSPSGIVYRTDRERRSRRPNEATPRLTASTSDT